MKKIFLLLFIALSTFESRACSCNFPTEIPKAFKITNTVVHGQVVHLRHIKVMDAMNPDSLSKFKSKGIDQNKEELLETDFIIVLKLHNLGSEEVRICCIRVE